MSPKLQKELMRIQDELRDKVDARNIRVSSIPEKKNWTELEFDVGTCGEFTVHLNSNGRGKYIGGHGGSVGIMNQISDITRFYF